MFQTLLRIVRMAHPKNLSQPPLLGSVICRMQGAGGCDGYKGPSGKKMDIVNERFHEKVFSQNNLLMWPQPIKQVVTINLQVNYVPTYFHT